MVLKLSQLLSKNSYYDKDVPPEGHWTFRIEVQNGKIVYAEKTEKIKEYIEKEMRQMK